MDLKPTAYLLPEQTAELLHRTQCHCSVRWQHHSEVAARVGREGVEEGGGAGHARGQVAEGRCYRQLLQTAGAPAC